jgi:hypothetical protein
MQNGKIKVQARYSSYTMTVIFGLIALIVVRRKSTSIFSVNSLNGTLPKKKRKEQKST